jgi:hypothetical protein
MTLQPSIGTSEVHIALAIIGGSQASSEAFDKNYDTFCGTNFKI